MTIRRRETRGLGVGGRAARVCMVRVVGRGLLEEEKTGSGGGGGGCGVRHGDGNDGG